MKLFAEFLMVFPALAYALILAVKLDYVGDKVNEIEDWINTPDTPTKRGRAKRFR